MKVNVNKLSKKILKNELCLYLLVLFFMTCISTVFVIFNTEKQIDVQSYYEDIRNHNFHIERGTEMEVKTLGNNAITFYAPSIEEQTYITNFDGNINFAPTENYREMATIPEGTQAIQIDIDIGGYNVDKDYKVFLYLQAFNEDEEVTKITKEIDLYSTILRSRPLSYKLDVSDECKYYRVTVGILPTKEIVDEPVEITISNLSIIFK